MATVRDAKTLVGKPLIRRVQRTNSRSNPSPEVSRIDLAISQLSGVDDAQRPSDLRSTACDGALPSTSSRMQE